MYEDLLVKKMGNGVVFHVAARARSSRNEIYGMFGQRLKILTTAPAERGEANKAVLELLRKKLKVPASRLAIATGQWSERKGILMRNTNKKEFIQLLEQML